MYIFNDNYFKSVNFSKLISVHDNLIEYINLRRGKLSDFVNSTVLETAMKCSNEWDYREYFDLNNSIPSDGTGFLFKELDEV